MTVSSLKKKNLKMCLISRFQADTSLRTHADHMLANGKDPGWKAKALGADWPGELSPHCLHRRFGESQGHYQWPPLPGVSLSEGACALFPAIHGISVQRSESGCSPCLEAVGGEGKASHMGKRQVSQIPFYLMCSSTKLICSG